MTMRWQLVDLNGELVDEDDTSSISSDWSFMQYEFADKIPLRSHSADGRISNRDYSSDSSHVTSTGKNYDCAGKQDNDHNSFASNSACKSRNQNNSLNGNHVTNKSIHTRSASTTTWSASPRSVAWLSGPNPVKSRRATRRWNANHKRNRTNMNVDIQHAKCLRGGTMINHGFQRHQIRMGNGGQYPQRRT